VHVLGNDSVGIDHRAAADIGAHADPEAKSKALSRRASPTWSRITLHSLFRHVV
jgi:hypothetical protein